MTRRSRCTPFGGQHTTGPGTAAEVPPCTGAAADRSRLLGRGSVFRLPDGRVEHWWKIPPLPITAVPMTCSFCGVGGGT